MFLLKEEDPSLEDEEVEPMKDPDSLNTFVEKRPRYGR
jgi:hypothetical protein